METLNTENNTVRMENMILSYLNKTAKHLFVNQKGDFVKIMPYKKDDKWFIMVMTFNGENMNFETINIGSYITNYGLNSKHLITTRLFPSYDKKHSIPNFKEMKKRMFDVYKTLQHTDDTSELAKHLIGLTVNK